MFSARLPRELTPNALACLRREADSRLIDLTESNPTRCGFPYSATLLAPLAAPAGLEYDPDPCGSAGAREAIAGEYRRRGVAVDPGRILVTASTSEGYSFLFKLLCDPGDAVLVPQPSYPLFEHLAVLDGAEPRPYLLDPDDGWQPRPQTESFDRVRAVIVVHPNNPTGTHVLPDAAIRIRELCLSHDAALIVDEVFLDYPLDEVGPRRSFAGDSPGLTFVLGGLSKSLGLPQLKLAWVLVDGPEGPVDDALEALAYIADNYLNVSTPVQNALPALLKDAGEIREAIRTRCRENLRQLEARAAESPTVSLVMPEGGWSAVLRFPRVIDEERLALELLREHGVATHPGFFFDFPRDGHLVVSLLPAPGVFAEGIDAVLGRIAREVGP